MDGDYYSSDASVASFTPYGNPGGLLNMEYMGLGFDEGALTAVGMLNVNCHIDAEEWSRNRWTEQSGRGGKPDPLLLVDEDH